MVIFIFIILIIIFNIAAEIYYKSDSFIAIKNSILNHINECNDLNNHIEELKQTHTKTIHKSSYGVSNYTNTSKYNYKKTHLLNAKQSQKIVDCSITVCRNAQKEPFKYFCKYFNVPINEETLSIYEKILNDFEAVEQGKILLKKQEEQILSDISDKIPKIISVLDKNRLKKKLGFNPIDFSDFYFPKYTFRYVSAGGNSSNKVDLIFNLYNLNEFVEYLSNKIKFKKSVAGQRALMTSKLREQIKNRDNYTCKKCNLSIQDEPNLLLEIDHIIPISKGGITTENNLQTLCWKCNRSKGSKIETKE